MFLKAYDLFISVEKIGFDFGCGLCWSCFCLQSVLKEQFLKITLTFSSTALYHKLLIIIQIFYFNEIQQKNILMKVNKKIEIEWKLESKI